MKNKEYWDHFNMDLYIKILAAKAIKNSEYG